MSVDDTDTTAIIRRLALDVFRLKRVVEPYSEAQFLLELVVFMNEVQSYLYAEDARDLDPLLSRARRLAFDYQRLGVAMPDVRRYLEYTIEHLELGAHPWRPAEGRWLNERLTKRTLDIPAMLYPETKQYYKWLARQYTGAGEVVELGSWLGGSTAALLEGLTSTGTFERGRLHVFDAFVWEAWMDRYAAEVGIDTSRFAPGDSFLPTFRRNLGRRAELVDIHVARLDARKASGDVPQLEWDGSKIELLVNDFSSDGVITRKLWKVFEPSFVRGITVVVFNQFSNKRAEHLRRFISQLGDVLVPLHKPHGSAKSFRYEGRARSATRQSRMTRSVTGGT